MISRRLLLSMMAAAPAASLNGIGKAETLMQVGSTPTGVPFTFLDTASGTIQGMMVDLIHAVGDDLNFKVQIQPMGFSSLIPALTSGKIEIISAAMSASPERAKVVDFTDQVYAYGEGAIVPSEDKAAYPSIQAMQGYRVGAQVGTRYLDLLQKSGVFSEVRSYETIADIITDVAAGRLQAGFGDGPILGYQFSHASYPKVRLVGEYKPFVVGPVNIGVRKGQEALVTRMNATIAKFKSDGTLAKILAKWNLPASAS
ncbi:ABC transporter substrate-binding protein [Bradyrhizobium sp. CCBAU 45389]|nr:ABC transporter substrate-binding protein [Bradyrhizobium sp. CCBAU 45389]